MNKIDKSTISTCNILGVNIAAINMKWLIDFTKNHIKELSGEYICVSNVHTTITAFDDASYRDVQNNAILAIPDGGPLSSLGKKRGFTQMARTTGPDYMGEILKISKDNGYKHYFYGSTNETLQKLQIKLKCKFGDINIVGMYSPPFRPLTEEEDKKIINEINNANPDFVWVGLGAPKQEKWMSQHQGKIKGLMVGIGAAFDYFAGNIKRAPVWMQKCNVEWLYRLIQDPKRLIGRYTYTNTKFLWNAVVRGK